MIQRDICKETNDFVFPFRFPLTRKKPKFFLNLYRDDKIKKSNPTAQGGKRLRGLDMYTGPIKNELIGAGLFLREVPPKQSNVLNQLKENIFYNFYFHFI